MKGKAVIFDMDGVICHTNPYHSRAFKAFFAKRGLYPAEVEFVEHMYGKSNSYILSHFLGRPVTGEEFIQMENEKEGLFREIYKSEVKSIAGFDLLLAALRNAGYKTAVATSAPQANMELIVSALGLESEMDSFMASEDVTHHKPHPEIYLRTAGKLGIHPRDCLVFEDSFSGITAAAKAGACVIGVLSSHSREELPPCDHYISDFREISLSNIEKLLQR